MTDQKTVTQDVTLEQVLNSLSDPTERRILTQLAHHDPRKESEFDTRDFDPEDEPLDVFSVKLYHKHLPALAERGFVEWDRDTGTITRGENFGAVEPLITLMQEHQDELPWDWP